ncbi:MAG: redoxin domain-containing protein, partial [Saprospiraceae bacterium]|nr:redoxin domain-containing protein [Saprospiraceae bacterium]
VVLVFFPLAFSRVCTQELCAVRDDLDTYNDVDAVVLAISTDSLYTLRQYRETNNYNFLLLSDYNKEVSRCYGALHEDYFLDMKGVTKRAVFVIDRKGVVKHKEILEDPAKLPNFELLKDTLRSLT